MRLGPGTPRRPSQQLIGPSVNSKQKDIFGISLLMSYMVVLRYLELFEAFSAFERGTSKFDGELHVRTTKRWVYTEAPPARA